MELTRITNDVNGNPRYVVHFMELCSDKEIESETINNLYLIAIKKARKVGGKKYHTKNYGGGIVFQSYNTTNLIDLIYSLRNQ